MTERVHAQHRVREAQDETTADTPTQAETGNALKAELDALLDEIDGVLDENAEEMVKNYIQAPGE